MNKDQITYFEVDRDGRILYQDFEEIETRSDAYNFSREYDVATPERLISFAKDCPPLQWKIGSHYTEYREDPAYPDRIKIMPEEPEYGWTNWVLGMDKKTFSTLRKKIKIWMSEEPDLCFEEDYIDYRKFNDGAVFDFFEGEPGDVLDALEVNIIDGPYPGNNYRGAELCRPIEEANAIAERMGLDYRFKEAKEEETNI